MLDTSDQHAISWAQALPHSLNKDKRPSKSGSDHGPHGFLVGPITKFAIHFAMLIPCACAIESDIVIGASAALLFTCRSQLQTLRVPLSGLHKGKRKGQQPGLVSHKLEMSISL